MATTTAWQQRYLHVLTDQLGLDAETGAGDKIHIITGAGLHYLLETATDPDTAPHTLDIILPIALPRHHHPHPSDDDPSDDDPSDEPSDEHRHDPHESPPSPLHSVAAALTATTSGGIKAIPTNTRHLVLVIQATLAAPGTLPSPDLIAAVLPTHLNNLATAYTTLHIELQAAALYHR